MLRMSFLGDIRYIINYMISLRLNHVIVKT